MYRVIPAIHLGMLVSAGALWCYASQDECLRPCNKNGIQQSNSFPDVIECPESFSTGLWQCPKEDFIFGPVSDCGAPDGRGLCVTRANVVLQAIENACGPGLPGEPCIPARAKGPPDFVEGCFCTHGALAPRDR